MNKKNLLIVVIVFFIAYVLYKYLCDYEETIVNKNLLTCSNLNQLSFGDQLFRVTSIIGLAKKHGKQAVFPPWTMTNIFDNRIAKYFINEIPFIAERKKVSNNHSSDLKNLQHCSNTDFFKDCVSKIRLLLTFNYEYSLMIVTRLPCLMQNCCVGVYFDSKDTDTTEEYYITALDSLLAKFPTITIVFFCDKWQCFDEKFPGLQKYKLTNNVFISPFGCNENDNFIAFSLCSFKVMSNVNNSFQWWAAWLNNRFNSIVIAPIPQQPLNYFHWNFYDKELKSLVLHDGFEKVGGIIFYNLETFNTLCEAFRRIYPTSALKVLVQPEQIHIVADIEFFRGQILPTYKNATEFLDLVKTFIEPFFVFLVEETQFDYPINTKLPSPYLYNTGDMQLRSVNDVKLYRNIFPIC